MTRSLLEHDLASWAQVARGDARGGRAQGLDCLICAIRLSYICVLTVLISGRREDERGEDAGGLSVRVGQKPTLVLYVLYDCLIYASTVLCLPYDCPIYVP